MYLVMMIVLSFNLSHIHSIDLHFSLSISVSLSRSLSFFIINTWLKVFPLWMMIIITAERHARTGKPISGLQTQCVSELTRCSKYLDYSVIWDHCRPVEPFFQMHRNQSVWRKVHPRLVIRQGGAAGPNPPPGVDHPRPGNVPQKVGHITHK